MTTQKQVIILGAGYAGLMAAMRLANKTKPHVAITLVSQSDVFVERVRNHQLAVGQALPTHAISHLLARTRIQFVPGTVTNLRPAQRQVIVQTAVGEQTLTYDYLVYALGSTIAISTTPGVAEHAYTLDYHSAAALAEQLPQVARQGGRVLIVGGGNTGVEMATELGESYPGLQITLVTSQSFAHNLSIKAQAYIRRAFERMRITFREHVTVTQLERQQAITAVGETIPFDVCIWVGGFTVSDVACKAGLHVNKQGQILIDRAMRSLSHPEIYAVGDSAFPVAEPGAPIRMSLYTAIMMGAHGADCLAARLNGKQPTAFGLSYIALGLSLGRQDGVVQFLGWDTDRPLNLILTGRLANRFREFFVKFALWAIQVQRTMPWAFDWPGKRKMWRMPVTTPGWREQVAEG